MSYKPTVCFDFDGVIHSYTSSWRGYSVIPDPPVDGIKEVLQELKDKGYIIAITTSRALQESGKFAVEKYLNEYGIPYDAITAEKVPCVVAIDDRAITFDGETKGLVDKITSFQPWNRKE